MNILKIKDNLLERMNKKIDFKYNGNRNQIEKFSGKIIKCYKSIFLIELPDKTTKTFSYTDILIGNLEILV